MTTGNMGVFIRGVAVKVTDGGGKIGLRTADPACGAITGAVLAVVSILIVRVTPSDLAKSAVRVPETICV